MYVLQYYGAETNPPDAVSSDLNKLKETASKLSSGVELIWEDCPEFENWIGRERDQDEDYYLITKVEVI